VASTGSATDAIIDAALDFSGMRSITSGRNCRRENPIRIFYEGKSIKRRGRIRQENPLADPLSKEYTFVDNF